MFAPLLALLKLGGVPFSRINGRFLRLLQPGGGFHHFDQLGNVEGLGDVVVHACGEAIIAVAFHGAGGERDDRHVIA